MGNNVLLASTVCAALLTLLVDLAYAGKFPPPPISVEPRLIIEGPNNGGAPDNFGQGMIPFENKLLIGAFSDAKIHFDAGRIGIHDQITGELFDEVFAPVDGRFFGLNFVLVNGFLVASHIAELPNTEAGVVHVFDMDNWSFQRTITDPFPEPGNSFAAGEGEAIAVVGNNVAIGTRNTNGPDVHLFDPSTGNRLNTFQNPNPESRDFFGVSIESDGEQVWISDFAEGGSGVVYAFDVDTATLSQTINHPRNEADSQFGRSLAESDRFLFVGSWRDDLVAENGGAVYMFDKETGDLIRTFVSPTPTLGQRFGIRIAAVGKNLFVSATNGSTEGDVYLFDIATGDHIETFFPNGDRRGSVFGNAIAATKDSLFVGDPNFEFPNGAVYIYDVIPEPTTIASTTLAICMFALRRRELGRD